jgi:hypothetical protein
MTGDFNPRDTRGAVGKLLNFDQMIGPSLIRFIYFAGLVLIALYAVVVLIGGLAMLGSAPIMGLGWIVGGAVLLVIGTVMWRFSCELWVLLFKIHDRIGEVRDRLPPR